MSCLQVPPSPSNGMPSPGAGGLTQQLAQHGMGTPSPGGKKTPLPRDIFSLSYSIDRQRALHVDALPDEEDGPGIRAMFEKLCLERGLIGGAQILTICDPLLSSSRLLACSKLSSFQATLLCRFLEAKEFLVSNTSWKGFMDGTLLLFARTGVNLIARTTFKTFCL